MSDEMRLLQLTVEEAVGCLEYGWDKLEHCLAQLSEDQVWWRPVEELNSVGNLLLHMNGNLRQWIVSGIGLVVDTRDRPAEFAERGPKKKKLLLETLRQTIDDCERVIRSQPVEGLVTPRTVQGFETNGVGALWQSITHFQGHVQEVTSLTRQQLGTQYQFHWTPDSD